MKLRIRATGMAMGTLAGLAMCIGTWWLLMWGSPGGVISSAHGFFYGYSYTFIGGLIGLFWGFVWGFIGGVLIAWSYNMFSKIFYKSEKTAE